MTSNVLRLTLPLRIVSELNMREHHMMRAKRAAGQRAMTRFVLSARLSRHGWPTPPIVVTLTRVAGRMFDDDNVACGFKHIRDAIAEVIGINDGDLARLRFVYTQRKAPANQRTNEVEVEIRASAWTTRRMEARR